MDLSKLKWPIIIIVVVGGIWLISDGGINYMYNRFSSDPGGDAKRAELNEAGLTKLSSWLMMTMRFGKAEQVLTTAVDMYPDGKNSRFNLYRLARAKEKLGRWQESIDILQALMNENAHETFDDRIPTNDELLLRKNKLLETHELGEVGGY